MRKIIPRCHLANELMNALTNPNPTIPEWLKFGARVIYKPENKNGKVTSFFKTKTNKYPAVAVTLEDGRKVSTMVSVVDKYFQPVE